MIIKPMVRNNVCLNSHPSGCAAVVRRQIEYAKKTLKSESNMDGITPKLALIIGCSNGYGLASRIAAAFGYGAATVGVSLEKAASQNHTATPGYYNNLVFSKEAAKASLFSRIIDGDAYSDEIKTETAKAIREISVQAGIPSKIDLIIYSLASPVRVDPESGVLYRSVIKPIGTSFSGKNLNMMDGTFSTAEMESASQEEITNTVKVMGGEDWERWIKALDKENLLSPNTRTVSYTYIGPEHSWPIYKNGTIGKAKEDLERAACNISELYKKPGKIAGAWVSVNKALVTRSSAVIPVIPLYVSCLFKVMKEMGLHETCIEQIVRLYKDRLYISDNGVKKETPVDSEGRIHIDDLEMKDDVQKKTAELMASVTEENVFCITDVLGFKHDFLEAHGFDVEGVDYSADIDPCASDF